MATLTQFWDSLTGTSQITKKLDELKKLGEDNMNALETKLRSIIDQMKAANASSAESDANLAADIQRVLDKLRLAGADPALLDELQATADAATAAAEARKATAAIVPEE